MDEEKMIKMFWNFLLNEIYLRILFMNTQTVHIESPSEELLVFFRKLRDKKENNRQKLIAENSKKLSNKK